jgi:hypothetical protein
MLEGFSDTVGSFHHDSEPCNIRMSTKVSLLQIQSLLFTRQAEISTHAVMLDCVSDPVGSFHLDSEPCNNRMSTEVPLLKIQGLL